MGRSTTATTKKNTDHPTEETLGNTDIVTGKHVCVRGCVHTRTILIVKASPFQVPLLTQFNNDVRGWH